MTDLALKARQFAQERRIGYAEHWDLLNELADEIERQGSKLDTLQKNYDLGQAALALAESEGREVASRWATAVGLLEKAETRLSSCHELLQEVADWKPGFNWISWRKAARAALDDQAPAVEEQRPSYERETGIPAIQKAMGIDVEGLDNYKTDRQIAEEIAAANRARAAERRGTDIYTPAEHIEVSLPGRDVERQKP